MGKWIAQFVVLRKENLCALALILFFIVFNFFSMRNLSLTYDEKDHYAYGVNILNGNTNRLVHKSGIVDDSKMPMTALNAIPAKVALQFQRGRLNTFLKSITAARFVTVLFSAMVAWLVFSWSRSLYGFIPGMASLLLYTFDPNIIAHSQLVTTDVYAMGMIVFSCYWLWKYANSHKIVDGLIFAFILGVSQLAKYTAIALFPLSILALIGHDWRLAQIHDKKYLGKLLLAVLFVIIISLLVINAGYLFNHTFTMFKDYQFRSEEFKWAQTEFPWLGRFPVPVPYPFLQGMDLVFYRVGSGFDIGTPYLLGNLAGRDGFKGYYFVASFFKVPIATQIILCVSLFVYLWNKKRGEHFWQNEIFILLPVSFFIIYFNFFYNVQIGIRFYLVIFPLLYVFAGQLLYGWVSFSRITKIALCALAVYLGISVLSYYPHYISYFNEFVWNRTMSYKYLADSNLDWGQNKNYLSQYMKTHPEAIYEPTQIEAGQIIVSANDLLGIGVGINPSKFAWLKENFTPTGTVAYSYLIFDISQQDLARLCQTKSICP